MMGRKGEFLSSKANVLVHVLHDRGWEIEGDLCVFTAVFHDITMNYKDGDIEIWRGSEEIMRLKVTDIL